MVSGINNGYYNPYQPSALDRTSYTPITYQQPILTGGVEQNDYAVNAKKDNTADGKDDGSIGFWGATKNMIKGAWNFITSPFKNDKGEWSLGATLKSVAIAGLFIAGNALTGGALTPILLAGGAIMGVGGAVKAGVNIANAKTDAEAEAAWQSMGSSAATIATTAIGAKGYAKASAKAAGMSDAEISARYGGVKGIKNSVGKTFVDSKENIISGKRYLFGGKEVLAKDGTVKRAAVDGKVQQKWAQIKDNYQNSTEKSWYGKAGDVAKKEYGAAFEKGKNFVVDNSGVYRTASEQGIKFADLTTRQKAAVVKQLRNSIAIKAKTQLGYQKGKGFWKNTQNIVSNPQNIGIQTWLTTQSFKPDFYDSLSTQERAYFDSLPKEQQEQMVDMYYSMVA